jgi:phosphate transport system permease protein
MFKPENLIRKGLPKGHFRDIAVRFLLGGSTYLVVIIAALLFGKIIVDGAPVLFKAEA